MLRQRIGRFNQSLGTFLVRKAADKAIIIITLTVIIGHTWGYIDKIAQCVQLCSSKSTLLHLVAHKL